MNSWQEDRERRQREPQVPRQHVIIILEAALKEGQGLASKPSSSGDRLELWELMTHHWLELAFGKGEHSDSFKRAGPAPRPGPKTDAELARERKEKLRAQVNKLEFLVAVLKQPPESPAALSPLKSEAPAAKQAAIDIFISHSTKDKVAAKAIADLLRTALCLSAKRIRCTSVDGYTLTGGANVAETLRDEIKSSRAFLALMTANSAESQYVSAEIGARWMAGGYTVMLFGGGYKPCDVHGPLADTNGLTLSEEPALHKLIAEAAAELGVPPEPADSYLDQLKALAVLGATQRAATATQAPQPQPVPELSTELMQTLQVFVERDDEHRGPPGPKDLAQALKIQVSDAKDRLARLVDARMLTAGTALDPYRLTQPGRAYILQLRTSKAAPE